MNHTTTVAPIVRETAAHMALARKQRELHTRVARHLATPPDAYWGGPNVTLTPEQRDRLNRFLYERDDTAA